MKQAAQIIAFLLAALCAPALAQSPVLPKAFAGWEKVTPSELSKDPAAADQANAQLMKEYGFAEFEAATYTRPGRQIKVRAARFADASGAYGAFTFYKAPEMLSEKFGDQGATWNERILFYRGNVLVQATLDKVTAMSAAELRQLADAIPLPAGTARNLPVLPTYLPKQSYVKNSAKYVMGPVGLGDIGAPLSAQLVDFTRGAEVVIGKYNTDKGTATLMLVSYPTPAIAGERLRAIEAVSQNPTPAAQATADVAGPLNVKRSGPMVVVVAGQISSSEAKSLLAAVNYDADITWNENTFTTKKENVANLLVNVIVLIFIILALALVAGIAFGGVRLLVKRFMPGRVFDRPEEMEIIELKLRKPAPPDITR